MPWPLNNFYGCSARQQIYPLIFLKLKRLSPGFDTQYSTRQLSFRKSLNKRCSLQAGNSSTMRPGDYPCDKRNVNAEHNRSEGSDRWEAVICGKKRRTEQGSVRVSIPSLYSPER